MKTFVRIAVFATCVVVMFLLELQLVPEAQAVLGVRRRTAVRTAVVVGSAYSVQTAQAQQQAAAAQAQAAAAQAAAAQAQAAAAQAAAAPPPSTGALPVGTVVSALPAGCSTKPIGGVEYYACGSNYYRAAFQGSQLVYVTAQP
jgi:hypothetical protein